MRNRIARIIIVLCVVLATAAPALAADDLAAKLQAVLADSKEKGFWQISADDLQSMIAAKKTDFAVVDVRPNPAEYGDGHIPGAIQIPVQDMFKPESLKKLPMDKKLILYCVTGQVQNLPVLGLRAMGYDAHLLVLGYTSWGKDYAGGKRMQTAIQNAADKNYPVEK